MQTYIFSLAIPAYCTSTFSGNQDGRLYTGTALSFGTRLPQNAQDTYVILLINKPSYQRIKTPPHLFLNVVSQRWKAYRGKHLEKYLRARELGAVDPAVVPLLDCINARPDYVTTSSCSGRIVLLSTSSAEKKGDSFFYRKWHHPVTSDDVWDALTSYSGSILWFKLDPFILHIGAENLSSAFRIIDLARSAGVKIAGIQSADSSKIHVEIRGIDSIAIPFYDGKPLLGREYVKHIVRFANRKIVKNAMRLARLFSIMSDRL